MIDHTTLVRDQLGIAFTENKKQKIIKFICNKNT